MPRDVSGNYTLPAGINPVVTNTLIDIDWANPTLNDIATQLNNVLTRDGLLGPTTVFKVQDGVVAAPSLSFASQTGTGLYRPAATNALAVSVLGTERGRFTTTGLDVTGTVTATDLTTTGNTTLGNASTDTLNVGNGGIVKDSSGKVGIGRAPATTLDVQSLGLGIVRLRGGTADGQGAAYYVSLAGSDNTMTALGDRAAIFGGPANQEVVLYTNNLPLVFAQGSSSPVERMRISADGITTLFGSNLSQALQIYTNNETGSLSSPLINTFNTNAGEAQQFVAGFNGQNVFLGNRRTAGALDFYAGDVHRMRIAADGAVTIAGLAGTGNRQVMVDATGRLYAT